MGQWSFSKNAGKNICRNDSEVFASDLQDEIASLGLISDDIRVKKSDDSVTLVGGIALSDEDIEKLVLVVGNVRGIASVSAEIRKEPKFCAVKKGDTASIIAERYLGDRERERDVVAANYPMISSAKEIFAGQVLRLPK